MQTTHMYLTLLVSTSPCRIAITPKVPMHLTRIESRADELYEPNNAGTWNSCKTYQQISVGKCI